MCLYDQQTQDLTIIKQGIKMISKLNSGFLDSILLY